MLKRFSLFTSHNPLYGSMLTRSFCGHYGWPIFSRAYPQTVLSPHVPRVRPGNKRRTHPVDKRLFSRFVSTGSELAPSPDLKPAEETEDVTAIDNLMNIIRQRSDPIYRSVMPVRTPLLWSETISPRSTPPPISAPAAPSTAELSLSTRNMQDSYSELILPFHSQPTLLDQYTNAQGGLRAGKLMEHLDSLAGSIAYKHVLGPGVSLVGDVHNRGFYIVTAAVDRLDMLIPLTPENVRDIRLCGHVIYTGRSSMEVVVKMELLEPGKTDETIMLGRFSMVCLDAFTQKAKAIPRSTPSTPEEHALFAMGEAHKERKKALALTSLDRVPPSSEEATLLHRLFLQHKQNNGQTTDLERVWMEDTTLENCLLMFPQERNVHSKIFGGYLMRLAYELSGTATALFSRRPLRFLSLDGLSFSRPVPIGSILRLTSRIACTESTDQYPALVHATVKANVVDVESGTEQTTNDFRFTWCQEHGPPLRRRVSPRTYPDAMEWLEAKRALEIGNEIRKLRQIRANSRG